jgi:hypothetical protein
VLIAGPTKLQVGEKLDTCMADMQNHTTNQVLATATVAVLIVTLVALFRNLKKRRLTSREGYPLPPGPPAQWFWDNVMPTVKSDYPAYLISMG